MRLHQHHRDIAANLDVAIHLACAACATAVQHQRFTDISAQAVCNQWY
jgi:hypothetical protein